MKINGKISTLLSLGLFASSVAFAEIASYTSYEVNEDGTLTAVTVDYDTEADTTYTSNLASPTEAIEDSLFIGITTNGTASGSGGAAITTPSAAVGTIEADFVNNYFNRTNTYNNGGGGALQNTTTLTVYGDFLSNTWYSGNGTSTTTGGGAICNRGNNGNLTVYGDFIANTAYGAGNRGGGAVYNNAATATFYGSFFGNNTQGTNSAGGGAIYNTAGTINLNSELNNIYFTGNTATGVSNAIYNIGAGTINFNASESYSIIVNDGINGAINSSLNINSGTTYFNNTVSTQIINVADSATLVLGSYAGTTDLYGDGSGTVVAASNASITGSNINLADGSTLVLTDGVTFNSNTWTVETGATIALDLEDIFGDFSITLDFSDDASGLVAMEALLASGDLDLIIDDTFYDVIDNGDGTYSVDCDYLSDFSIGTNGSIITFTGTAVPEPSTYAMIFGVIALGFAAYRRRK